MQRISKQKRGPEDFLVFYLSNDEEVLQQSNLYLKFDRQ